MTKITRGGSGVIGGGGGGAHDDDDEEKDIWSCYLLSTCSVCARNCTPCSLYTISNTHSNSVR